MADTRSIRRLPSGPIVDIKTGMMTPEAERFFDTLIFGGGANTIGKQVSGVAEAAAAAAAAQETADDATDQLSVVDANLAAVSAGSTGFSASVSPSKASGTISGAGTVTTNSVTVTPTGGIAPYTYAWSTHSGDVFSATSASSASTTFTISVGVGDSKNGQMKCVVTDSTGGTPLTTTIYVLCIASEIS